MRSPTDATQSPRDAFGNLISAASNKQICINIILLILILVKILVWGCLNLSHDYDDGGDDDDDDYAVVLMMMMMMMKVM